MAVQDEGLLLDLQIIPVSFSSSVAGILSWELQRSAGQCAWLYTHALTYTCTHTRTHTHPWIFNLPVCSCLMHAYTHANVFLSWSNRYSTSWFRPTGPSSITFQAISSLHYLVWHRLGLLRLLSNRLISLTWCLLVITHHCIYLLLLQLLVAEKYFPLWLMILVHLLSYKISAYTHTHRGTQKIWKNISPRKITRIGIQDDKTVHQVQNTVRHRYWPVAY